MLDQETQTLKEEIRALRPWHHNIQITRDVDVRSAFDSNELVRSNNENVGFLDVRDKFRDKVEMMYPDGLAGKQFLDCACNGGGYCFWASELGAEIARGFDVREHWIKQAEFARKHRAAEWSDRVQFEVCDLMELPNKNYPPADFTLFKGIFYHLADPILGLKIVSELTNDILWFNSARQFNKDSQSLYCTYENPAKLMSGVHSLSWIPTGPLVVAKMLFWLGFVEVVHLFSKEYENDPGRGRMEIMASRSRGKLDKISEHFKAKPWDVKEFEKAIAASEDLRMLFK